MTRQTATSYRVPRRGRTHDAQDNADRGERHPLPHDQPEDLATRRAERGAATANTPNTVKTNRRCAPDAATRSSIVATRTMGFAPDCD